MPRENTLYLPELTEYRAAQTKRRAEAFCDAPDYVLGIEVLPLTPATFSMLVATGNSFVCGGKPTMEDAANYIWLHSRLYCHCGARDRDKQKRRALAKFVDAMCEP